MLIRNNDKQKASVDKTIHWQSKIKKKFENKATHFSEKCFLFSELLVANLTQLELYDNVPTLRNQSTTAVGS